MKEKYNVEKHPDRIEIEREIVAGKSSREIATAHSTDNYPLSKGSIQRYKENRLPVLIQKSEMETVAGLISRLQENVVDMLNFYNSIKETLRDPDTGEICYSPRASEIKAIFTRDGEKRKATLQQIIDNEIPEGFTIKGISLSNVDPRVMFVKATETLNKTLELLLKASGGIQEGQGLFTQNEWNRRETELISHLRILAYVTLEENHKEILHIMEQNFEILTASSKTGQLDPDSFISAP